MYLTKFDICRNVKIKLISYSVKTFKKSYIEISVNSSCKATTNPPPPPPFHPLSSVCWSIILPQKQNNVREYFQTDAKLSLLHLNVNIIPQVSSTPDWKSVVFILGTVSSAIIYINWGKKAFDQKVT